jgi:hypothetical protein
VSVVAARGIHRGGKRWARRGRSRRKRGRSSSNSNNSNNNTYNNRKFGQVQV